MIIAVAAGGNGTRLLPFTQFANKHLFPIYKGTLMIDYPMHMLAKSGAERVCVITGGKHATQIVDYLKDGEKYGLEGIDYAFQQAAFGIADVLKRIPTGTKHQSVLLVLGDNYFEEPQQSLSEFDRDKAGCWEFDIGSIELASRFGQLMCDENMKPIQIVEKPLEPTHSRVLTGMYYFPDDVFDKVAALEPSARNELEITDLLNIYLKEGRLDVYAVEGEWADLGEYPSLTKHIINQWSKEVMHE